MSDTNGDRRIRPPFLATEVVDPDADPMVAGGLTAMVVDDDQILLRLAANILTHVGFDVYTAGDGKQALFEFERRPCWLVLTDYEMPFINGYQLGLRIKARYPGTRTVIMTGKGRAEMDLLMNDSRIDGWLFKPFSLGQLTELLSRIGMPIERFGAF